MGRKGVDTMSDANDADIKTSEVLGLTSEIVAAHVSNNTVAMSDLPNLIEQVYKTLSIVGKGTDTQSERPTPAVALRKSVTPEYIICLEDGKKLKMLKRHLKTAYNMTPDEYRERWGLASDYPMVAPNYAKQRSKLAKAIGLGTRPRQGDKS
jgi:predicted transcriptional regulator